MLVRISSVVVGRNEQWLDHRRAAGGMGGRSGFIFA